MYYVYILYSKRLHKRYVGRTQDVVERLKEHNSGFGSEFTKKGIPWTLIHYQAFVNKEDACEEERFLKSGRGRERIKFLLRHTMESI